MIPSEVNKGERSHERLVKDVHSELKAPLTGANLWDSLDYFEISQAMRKRLNTLFPGFEWLSCAPLTSDGHRYTRFVAGWNPVNLQHLEGILEFLMRFRSGRNESSRSMKILSMNSAYTSVSGHKN
jgi:hypothetical protein